MDSERGYSDLSLLYMGCRLSYIQLYENIFTYVKISSNIEYMLKRRSIYSSFNSLRPLLVSI